jgi:hypothetical protein
LLESIDHSAPGLFFFVAIFDSSIKKITMKLNWQDALSDIEFVDPGVLVVGKGLIPGIGDSGLEMKNTPAFPAQLQMTNNDQRIQLLMQQNMQSTFKMHSTLSMIIIWHPRLFVQNRGSLSSRLRCGRSNQQAHT